MPVVEELTEPPAQSAPSPTPPVVEQATETVAEVVETVTSGCGDPPAAVERDPRLPLAEVRDRLTGALGPRAAPGSL